ncbi:hypothetical protein LK542_00100 [Massilia sp. IC2-477]|uniref:hypothetical protein n=1 Tax=Massilia sp. IC2-477 TaxID=2887198 RepID=UPI001D0F7EC5|nr:hypothetical protein [Massilia sp. IC2-477]MCC2954012.1 hypothetical protein [Massilia sp. IC2-477]
MEHESHHHHHPHGTGLRWLDITLGVAAGVVSLVSLWLGLHSAHSMEQLVASNSYPYLEIGRSTHVIPQNGAESEIRRKFEYELLNEGIGPARVEWVELTYKDKPMRDMQALVEACCSKDAKGNGLHTRGNVSNALIRPGASLVMMSWVEPNTPSVQFDGLHEAMKHIDLSACYCSVFDECYERRNDGTKPKPVEQCTPPKVTFQPTFQRSTAQ